MTVLPAMVRDRQLEGHETLKWTQVTDDFLEDQIGDRKVPLHSETAKSGVSQACCPQHAHLTNI